MYSLPSSLDKLKYLCNAIKKNDVEAVRGLLLNNPKLLRSNGSESNNRTTNDDSCSEDLSENVRLTPMWIAMLSGHVEIVETLIDFGADPNEPFWFEKNKFYGLTFLQSLALQDYFWQSSRKVAEVLIRRSALVFSAPIVQIALEYGNVEYVEFLLVNRLQLLYMWFFKTPKLKQKKMLKLLLKYGLDIKYRNIKGRNQLLVTIAHAIHFPDLDIDVLGITEVLLDAGLPVDELDNLEQSALFYAVRLQNFELVSLLVKQGADVNHKSNFDAKGLFPLYLAARCGNVQIVELLLSKGAKINTKSEDGQTAMHVACLRSNEKIIQLLIKKGADIRVEEAILKKTPFMLLRPWYYEETKVSCINFMIKEIAKKYFFKDYNINVKDTNLMGAYAILKEYFQICMKELAQMADTKFYPPYSYCCVLKIEKKIKKLAKLTKNKDFVSNFEANLISFTCYQEDLQRIWEEAIVSRDNSLIIELTLRNIFGNIFPDVVLRKLENHLTAEDLPL